MQLADIATQGSLLEQRILWLGSALTALTVVASLRLDALFVFGFGTALGTLYLYVSVMILRRCALALVSIPPRASEAVLALLIKGALFALFVYGVSSAAQPVLFGALVALLVVIPAAILTFRAGEKPAGR